MISPRYEVQIVHPVTGKPQRWDVYDTRERAEIQAARLRAHKLFAQVRRVDDDRAEPPEHNGERRRFLCWALMLGAIPPERLTERIVAELEREERAR